MAVIVDDGSSASNQEEDAVQGHIEEHNAYILQIEQTK